MNPRKVKHTFTKPKKMKLFAQIVLLFLFTSSSFSVIAQGVAFEKGNWEDIIKLAQEEKKLIFLDAYTSWCAPCKKMDKQTFPDEKVGAFYNKNFINVKLDMEKGEGPEVARQYAVQVYPTFLFIGMDGEVVHRNAGFFDKTEFIELGKVALDPSKSLVAMDKKFMEGYRDPNFLKQYMLARFNVRDNSHSAALDAYMDTQESLNTPENLELIFNYLVDADSKLFDHIVQNRSLYDSKFGKQNVSGKIQQMIYNKVYDTKEESSLDQLKKLYVRAYGEEEGARLASHFRLTFYRQAGDRENYALSAIDHYKKYPSDDPEELNETAWTFFNVIEDKKQLKKALKWAKRSVKLESNYYNNDTMAALLYKLGKKKKALTTAESAIAIAKSRGEDFSSTEQLITKIQGL